MTTSPPDPELTPERKHVLWQIVRLYNDNHVGTAELIFGALLAMQYERGRNAADGSPPAQD